MRFSRSYLKADHDAKVYKADKRAEQRDWQKPDEFFRAMMHHFCLEVKDIFKERKSR